MRTLITELLLQTVSINARLYAEAPQLNAENVFKYIKHIKKRWWTVGIELGIYDCQRTGSKDDRLMAVIKGWL